MHWTIQPNGHTAGVSVAPQSEEFKNTYIVGCMTGLIKGWVFPKHKSQQDPINFPFKF
jgi:hypothetical protein